MNYIFRILIIWVVWSASSCVKEIDTETIQSNAYVKLFGGSDMDFVVDIQYVDSDGYVVFGTSTLAAEGDNYQSAVVFRTDLYGNTVWEVSIADSVEYLAAEMLLTDDNIVLLSQTNRGGEGAPKDRQYCLTFVSFTGGILQHRKYGGPANETPVSITLLADQSILVGGNYTPANSSESALSDIFITKFSATGDSIWTRIIGSDEDDRLIQLENFDGRIFALGNTQGFALPGQSGINSLLFELSSEGGILQQNTYGANRNVVAASMIQNDQGIITMLTTQEFQSGINNLGVYSVDKNNIYETITTGTISGAVSLQGISVIYAPDGNPVVLANAVGVTDTDMYLTKISTDIETIWEYTWGSEGNETAVQIVNAYNQGYMIAGNIEFKGNSMMAIIKVAEDGTFNPKKTKAGN